MEIRYKNLLNNIDISKQIVLEQDYESEPSFNPQIKIEHQKFIELMQEKFKKEISMRIEMQNRIVD